jgi:hypothetical protein
MADKKISALTASSTPLAGTEVLPIVQGGATVKVAVSDLTAGRATSGSSFGGTSSNNTGNFPLTAANTSVAAVTTKYVGTLFIGADTIGTVKNVGSVAAIPDDVNWVGGSLAFSSRVSDALTEGARLDQNGYMLVGYTSSNGAYKLQVNSQIFATSATIATSDGRYKENVEPLANALSLVCGLRPVSFSWKEHPVHAFDRQHPTIGFIAQEVQKVLSAESYGANIVKSNTCVLKPAILNDAGKVATPAVTEEFLGIAEGNLIPLLTAALQEANAKIDALTDRVAVLEA